LKRYIIEYIWGLSLNSVWGDKLREEMEGVKRTGIMQILFFKKNVFHGT
jgi:hypothetical protein